MQRHFSHVSEDEAEAVVVLEDANGLVVCEAVEGAAIDLADLVARLECVILRVNTGKPMRVSHLGSLSSEQMPSEYSKIPQN